MLRRRGEDCDKDDCDEKKEECRGDGCRKYEKRGKHSPDKNSQKFRKSEKIDD